MKLNLFWIFAIITLCFACNKSGDNKGSSLSKAQVGHKEHNIPARDTASNESDIFLLIEGKAGGIFSLEKIEDNKNKIEKNDNRYSALIYFVDKHKEALKDVESVREASFRIKGKKEKVYLREWHFKSSKLQDSIKKELSKGFDGYAPPVKAPHYVFEKASKLYVLHVKGEYERQYMNMVKRVINDSILPN